MIDLYVGVFLTEIDALNVGVYYAEIDALYVGVFIKDKVPSFGRLTFYTSNI